MLDMFMPESTNIQKKSTIPECWFSPTRISADIKASVLARMRMQSEGPTIVELIMICSFERKEKNAGS
jgi:hypothetical protein